MHIETSPLRHLHVVGWIPLVLFMNLELSIGSLGAVSKVVSAAPAPVPVKWGLSAGEGGSEHLVN